MKNNLRKIYKFTIYLLVLILCALTLCACGKNKEKKSDRPDRDKKKKTQIILTTDFDEDEVFRIEKSSCYVPEIMVYLINSENQYDEIFGEQIWDISIDGETIEEKYKNIILARVAQIKVMNMLAANRDIELSEEEEAKVKSAARDYYDSLNQAEIDMMRATESDIYQAYHEYALADKLYYAITDEVNPEISDDEARTITVHSILVKTYSVDEKGNKVPFNESEKARALNQAQDIKARINDGTEFDVLADSYLNDDTKTEYSFGRGVMPEIIEETAFSMSNGDISDIIETEYGYHILKCVSTFNKDETDKNKLNIVEKRKQEAFNIVYDSFVVTLNSNLNEPLWESLSYTKSAATTTTSFFDIYDRYFVTEHFQM